MTYLRFMEKTSALSKYLQTSGLDCINSFNMAVATRAGEPEPEPERGAMEPANFGGAGAGAGAFLNISAEPEPELEPQKFY